MPLTYNHVLRNSLIKVLVCPADNSAVRGMTTVLPPLTPVANGGTSYVPNSEVFGNSNRTGLPMPPAEGGRLSSTYSIAGLSSSDGTSNTIIFFEQFVNCGTNGVFGQNSWVMPIYGNVALPGSTPLGGPVAGLNGLPALPLVAAYPTVQINGQISGMLPANIVLPSPAFNSTVIVAGMPRQAMDNVAPQSGPLMGRYIAPFPNMTNLQCVRIAGSGGIINPLHSASSPVGMSDGSVKLVSSRISVRTWAWLIRPDDGLVLGSDF